MVQVAFAAETDTEMKIAPEDGETVQNKSIPKLNCLYCFLFCMPTSFTTLIKHISNESNKLKSFLSSKTAMN